MYSTRNPGFFVKKYQRKAVGGIHPDNEVTYVCNNGIYFLKAFRSNCYFLIAEICS